MSKKIINCETILALQILKIIEDEFKVKKLPWLIPNNLKLQKILYFTYGIYYGITNEELIKEPVFLKWRLGPVNEELYYQINNFSNWQGMLKLKYDEFKKFLEEKFIINNDTLVNIDMYLLKEIVLQVNNINTFELVDKSHRTKPWIEADDSLKIDSTKIKNFFKGKNLDNFNSI